MTTERIIRIMAGSFVLLSVALGLLHSPWWFAFTAFVGFNLLQSGFTQFCPPEIILKKFGMKSCTCSKEADNAE